MDLIGYNMAMLWLPNIFTMKFYKGMIGKYGHFPTIPLKFLHNKHSQFPMDQKYSLHIIKGHEIAIKCAFSFSFHGLN